MKFRRFGNLDFSVSVLSLGLRHASEGLMDLVRGAIELGVNYIDIGYPYDRDMHRRKIETLSKALHGQKAEGVKVALTLPTYEVCSRPDLSRWLDEASDALGRQVDLCLFGLLNAVSWSRLKAIGAIEWMENAKQKGLVNWLGFCLHDDLQVLRRILADYEGWKVCQFQYSFLDIDHHPGIGGLQVAEGAGMAVVVSEPLKGGRVLSAAPKGIVELALKWVLGHREISTVILGTRNEGKLRRAIEILEEESFTSVEELTLLNSVREQYRKARPIPCLSCYCCMPCPTGIDAPRIMELYNDAITYGELETPRTLFLAEGHRPQTCTECGLCERNCPKKIPIVEWMKKSWELFGD